MTTQSSESDGQSSQPFLGVDIGGTKISVCLGSRKGEILAKRRFPTNPEQGPEDACRRIAEAIGDLAGGKPLANIVQPVAGISAPGPLSSRDGVFLNPPNMPTWHGFPIRKKLADRLDLKFRLMNDANAAALAEWSFGAGLGTQTLVYLTMSTGMGGGLIVGGQLHEGLDDMAGEVGHHPLAPDGPVGFGRRGSLEGFCSGPGIAQLAVLHLTQARHREKPSSLFSSSRDFRLVTMEEIGSAARDGDEVALNVFREVGEKLGGFCAFLVDLLNPEAIVVGTIGRIYSDLILPPANRAVQERCHPLAAQRARILPAALGEATGDLAAICAAINAERANSEE